MLSQPVVSDSVTPWTVAQQAPLSMGFSRQEYWGGLPFPSPGDLPNPGIEPTSLTSPALAGRFFMTSAPWEAPWTGWAAVKWALEPSSESGVFGPAPLLCTEETGYTTHPPGVCGQELEVAGQEGPSRTCKAA